MSLGRVSRWVIVALILPFFLGVLDIALALRIFNRSALAGKAL